jgi:Holliday junction DNA helicase RuvA
MIGRIAGRIIYRSTDHVLVDVQGVGYVVYCSERTLAGLPGNGEVVALFTDLLVREDILQLFGFETLLEKEWHRLLTSVQGIGAKASLSILGTLGPDGVGRAIALGDWGSLKAAKGIGPKTAQRVVNELKDKAPAVMALGGTLSEAAGEVQADADAVVEAIEASPTGRTPKAAPARPDAAAQADALSALSNLGYAPAEAASAVAAAAGETPDADPATLIREALQLLAPKG